MFAARNPLRWLPLAAVLLPLASFKTAGGAEGERWAVLIGVEKYHRATHLRYTVNDVEQLDRTLRERGGLSEDHVAQGHRDCRNVQPVQHSGDQRPMDFNDTFDTLKTADEQQAHSNADQCVRRWPRVGGDSHEPVHP